MAKNGLSCNAYTDDEGAGAGTWDDVNDSIEDLTVNGTKNTGSVKVRGSGEEKKIGGQRVRSIDLQIIDDPSDTLWGLCKANFESDDPDDYFGFAAMDGPLPAVGSDSNGLQMDVICTEFGQPQPLEDVVVRKIKLEPSHASTFEPTQATVAPA